MRLTPIEISQHRFTARMRGFDRDEVQAFLATIVADFEEVVRENAQLRREAERLARELDTYRGREKSIQETLSTAQGVVEQLQRNAARDAEQTLVAAELQSEKIQLEAREKHADLSREIHELRHLRARLDTDLRRTIDGYIRLIDAFGDAGTEEPARNGSAPQPEPRSG